MTRRKAVQKPVEAPPRPPWTKTVGQPCTFYHESGHGQNYWARGWRYGIIREDPIKGQHKGWMRVEIPVTLYGMDDKGKYYARPNERAWVNANNINEPGDYFYHGPKLHEEVAERAEAKAEQLAAKVRKPRTKKYVPAKATPKASCKVRGDVRAVGTPKKRAAVPCTPVLAVAAVVKRGKTRSKAKPKPKRQKRSS